jgi:ribonuclease Z
VTHLRVTSALAFFKHELSHATTLSLTHARRCAKGSAGLVFLRLNSPLTTLTAFTRTRQKTLLHLPSFVSTPPLVRPSSRLNLLCRRTFIVSHELKAQNIRYENTQHRSYHPSARRSRKADERWQAQLGALQELGQLGKRVQQRNEENSGPGEKLRSGEWEEIPAEGAAEEEGGVGNRTGNNRTLSRKAWVTLEESIQEISSFSTPLNQGLFLPAKPGALPVIIIPRKSPYNLSSIPEEVIFYSAGPRMHSFYQILCTPTADTPGTTILLHFEGNRYIFGNVPEGTQRMMVAQHVKVTNVRNVFISGQTKWSNTGGVLGFALCLADANASAAESIKQAQRSKGITPEVKALRRLGIHGGPNITHTIATARRFIFRKGTPMDVHEYGPSTKKNLEEPSFSDEYINVWAMPISPSNEMQGVSPKSLRKRSFDDFRESQSLTPLESTQIDKEDKEGAQEIRRVVVKEMFDSSWRHDALFETNLADVSLPAALFIRNPESNKIEPYKGKLPGDPEFPTDEPVTVLVRKPWPAAEINELPSTSPCREALSYIVKDHTQRGVFVTKKALDLGIPKGPLYRELSEGRNITLPDGRTITPDMVLGEPRWSVGIAILDVPSPEYIENMVSRPEWKSEKIMKGVNTMIWILGTSVVSDTRWLEFVDSMKTVEHIVASPDAGHNYLGLEDMAAASIRRHALDPDHFPMPVHEPSPNSSGSDKLESLQKNVRSASRNLILQTRPAQRIKMDEIPPYLDAKEVMQSVPDAVIQLGSDARSAMNDQRNPEDLLGDDVEIITLGTGSALPSKYRNVSGTLIRVPGQGSYLLDCGEGTLNQMRRVFPPQELKEVLRSLKVIWISHMHADHHLGTTSVIKAWYDEVFNIRSAVEEPQNGQTDQNGHDFADDLPKEPRLFVASTSPMIGWLREYSEVEDFGFHKIVPLTVSDKFINKSSNKIFCNSHVLDFNSPDSPM